MLRKRLTAVKKLELLSNKNPFVMIDKLVFANAEGRKEIKRGQTS